MGRLLCTGSKLQWNFHPPLTVRASSSLRITHVSLVDGGVFVNCIILYILIYIYMCICVYIYIFDIYIYVIIFTIWFFNIAMENGPFTDIKTSTYMGYSMATLNN